MVIIIAITIISIIIITNCHYGPVDDREHQHVHEGEPDQRDLLAAAFPSFSRCIACIVLVDYSMLYYILVLYTSTSTSYSL